MALITLLFKKLQIPIAPNKTVGPTTCLEYLGIILDTEAMEARLPLVKVQRIQGILQEFSVKKSCTKRELLSLLGHLNFASRGVRPGRTFVSYLIKLSTTVVRPGRTFVSYLIKLSTTVTELHHHVRITAEVRLDLDMWEKILRRMEWCVYMFLDDTITSSADLHIYTDSTDTHFGGIYGQRWFQDKFPSNLACEDEKMSMALLELYPIVVSCVLWGAQWKKLRILFHCDNMSTVNIINKGRSKVKVIMKLLRKLTWCSAVNNFFVRAEHVPGKYNDIADSLSRLQMERFRRLAPQADTSATQCPPYQI